MSSIVRIVLQPILVINRLIILIVLNAIIVVLYLFISEVFYV